MNKKQQKMNRVSDSNKILLEKTFALAQTTKLISNFLEKKQHNSTEKAKIINKSGKIFKRDYENIEVSSEHIMTLYKIANQEA